MNRILILATSSLALLGLAVTPSAAGGLVGGVVSGVTGTVGSVTGTVGGVVSGVTGTVGGVVGGVTGTVGGVVNGVTGAAGGTATGGAVGGLSNAVVDSTPRSTLLDGLHVRLKLLSKRELVRLCLNAGGAADCGGSQQQVMQVLDVKLAALSKRQLANLCVSVGSSCGVAGGTKVTASLLGPKGVANANVKSSLIGGINAKATVLSSKELLKLCLNAGGGTGCGIGSRNQILGVIDSRLAVLNPPSLLNLCLSVGGSCGGGNGGNGGGNPGGGNPGGGNHGHGPIAIAGMTSSSERQALQRRCPSILRNPTAFDGDLVRLCKLAARI